MSRTCANSLWLCHNATDKSTSQEILSSTGTSAPSGGQRVGQWQGHGNWPTSSQRMHASWRMHARTPARRHSREYDHISSCAMARPKDARAVAFLHPRPRVHACCHITHVPARPHPRACADAHTCTLEQTMTHAADASWHVACQCAGAASSACCVGKCTGACDQEDPQHGKRMFLLVDMGV
jgi:hypothetical protein